MPSWKTAVALFADAGSNECRRASFLFYQCTCVLVAILEGMVRRAFVRALGLDESRHSVAQVDAFFITFTELLDPEFIIPPVGSLQGTSSNVGLDQVGEAGSCDAERGPSVASSTERALNPVAGVLGVELYEVGWDSRVAVACGPCVLAYLPAAWCGVCRRAFHRIRF